MYQCHNRINASILFSVVVVLLSSLCAYCITEYTNELQMGMLNISNIPQSYRVLFKVSSTIAATIPIVIFLFLFFSTEILLNDFFGEKINKENLLNIIGISFTPMLIYQYVFWFNIIVFCQRTNMREVNDFLNMSFMYGLTLTDFEFINLVCWGFVYLLPILYYIKKDVSIVSTLTSFLLPSSLAIFFYYILTR